MAEMKKRWLSLFVENDVGVLAKISGLFSAKAYNLETLTVGTTEDETVSRMTISLLGDDATYEQIKKQLNRLVEVIRVIDLSDQAIHMKEILYLKVKDLSKSEREEMFRIAQAFSLKIVDYGTDSILLECVQTEARNNDIVNLVKKSFKEIEVVRGGSVAVEPISITGRWNAQE